MCGNWLLDGDNFGGEQLAFSHWRFIPHHGRPRMARTDHSEFPINVKLISGLLLQDAAQMLRAKFAVWPWAKFDGIAVVDPNIIGDDDVNTAFAGLGARTQRNRDELKRDIRGARKTTSRFLEVIPVHASLDDPSLDIAKLKEPIVGLFDCLTSIEGVKLANATKMTHRHRPALLPVLDSLVRDYYWFSASIHNEELFLSFRNMTWGEYGYSLIELIRADLVAAADELVELKGAIRDTSFGQASSLRLIESLVWYYYGAR